MINEKPTRCIDPVMKYCQECRYGHCVYPEWVETAEDLEGCYFDTFCIFGFENDRPTAEIIQECHEMWAKVKDTKPQLEYNPDGLPF